MKYYFLPLLIALASLLLTVSPAYVAGTGGEFAAPLKDGAQHLAGAYAYLDGDWQLPLFYTDRINHPQGTNIIFTDSVPLAGLLAKGVQEITGLRFNYMGMWFVLLWLGQAVAAAYLLRQLGVERPGLVAAGCILALLLPAFLYRHGHLALSSHFLLLFALGLYVRGVRAGLSLRWSIAWVVLLSVAVWVHAYLFVMTYALCMAAICDSVRRFRTFRAGVGVAVSVSLPPFLLAVLGGYLSAPPVAAEGYHFFTMNLLAPLWPEGAGIVGGELLDPTGGQYEGYNYLGMGLIGLILAAVALEWRRVKPLVQRGAVLMLLLLGLFCYSLSHQVWAGYWLLVQLPLTLDFFPFTTFRAAGRFFWPVAYVLLFGALFLLATSRRRASLIIAIIGTCLIVQMADASRLYRSMRAHIRHENPVDPELALFEQLARAHARVEVAPSRNCWSRASEEDVIQMTLMAARAGVPISVAHVARASGAIECAAEQQLAGWSGLEEGVLYVALLREGLLSSLNPVLYPSCRFIGHRFLICSRSARWPADTAVALEPVAPPRCPARYDLSNSEDEFSRWFDGFGSLEPWGRWTIGREAAILCVADAPGTVMLAGMGYQAQGETQRVAMQVNDNPALTGDFARDEVASYELPATSAGRLHVRLRIERPISPEALGEGPDGRVLGLKLLLFTFTPDTPLHD